jgi:hypothetical protein
VKGKNEIRERRIGQEQMNKHRRKRREVGIEENRLEGRRIGRRSKINV